MAATDKKEINVISYKISTETKALLDEESIIVQPSLAIAVGLNEAIILQQINYWLKANHKAGRNVRDGRVWTYNTIEDWRYDNFPFFSESTIKRAITNLHKAGLIIKGNYNTKTIDRTVWYSIDFEKVDTIVKAKMEEYQNKIEEEKRKKEEEKEKNREKFNSEIPLGQNDPMDSSVINPQNPVDKINDEDVNQSLGQNELVADINASEGLKENDENSHKVNMTLPLGQNDTSIVSIRPDQQGNMNQALPETSPKTSSETSHREEESPTPSSEIWESVKSILKTTMTEVSYNTWINNLTFAEATNEKFTIKAFNEFTKGVIETRYLSPIAEVLSAVQPNIKVIEVIIG